MLESLATHPDAEARQQKLWLMLQESDDHAGAHGSPVQMSMEKRAPKALINQAGASNTAGR